MNSNRRVLLFVAYSTVSLLLLSVIAESFHLKWPAFKRVNLITDITGKDTIAINDTSASDIPAPLIVNKPHEEFGLYRRGHFITNFNTDTSRPSLISFEEKLHDLKRGKKRKVRIAYFGDSMIEGDLLTQTFRKLLQQTFGGTGVGFVPITSQVSKFRQTVSDNYSDGWIDENFKTGNNNRLFISGHLFRTDGAWVQMVDQTTSDKNDSIEKSLLCGYTRKPVRLTINDHPVTITPAEPFNRITLDNEARNGIKLAVTEEQLPVYGISFESPTGIFVDNFSFRGITGIELANMDSSFLDCIKKNNPYDLIIFQYGVNMLYKPDDKNFNWYARAMLPVIKKFKKCFKESDILLISTADRAFRYDGEYRTAVGIDSLIKVQAALAFETNSGFYNQYETMGGHNSIVDWATRNPSLANKDYVHPNHRGAEILGNYFFNAIMNDYEKYVRSLK